jgi:hypothetical protein
MKGYIEEPSLFGHGFCIGFGDADFYVKEIDRDIANATIIKNHYSHKYYNASYIHLGVYMAKSLVGILQFGYAMNPASMGGVVTDTELDEYLELNRMWLDDIAPRNSESKAISYAIKYIRRKFPKIKWIQSFADERCGKFGIVYQAANFEYFGEHESTFWQIGDEWFHNTLMTAHNGKQGKIGNWLQANKDKATPVKLRQFRYLYFIDKRYKKDCVLQSVKAPKYYNEVSNG